MNRHAHSVSLTALLVLAAACSHRRAAPAPEPEAPRATSDAGVPRRDSLERSDAGERAARERAARLENDRRTLTATIYFEFDRSDLSAAAREALDAKLPILAAAPALRIRVDGHADDRGSDEYNLALGQRRAAAVKRYLTHHGIDAERVDVYSMGEERPVCTDADEGCWSRNRRDEFSVVAGEVALRP
jgi:peptidoglycan-associated lipoprotein